MKALLAWLLAASLHAATPAADELLASLPGDDPAAAGVAISISAEAPATLRVRFTPVRGDEPVHLYDTALPKTGLQGVGRPTLVELVPGQLVAAAGPAVAVQEPGPERAGLRAYPPGPVDLRLPLRVLEAPSGDSVEVEVLLTYMACGETFCQRPVTDRRVTVSLPTRLLAPE